MPRVTPIEQGPTYAIYAIEGATGARCIVCAVCLLRSWDENHVEQRYCGKCNAFHKREIAPGVTIQPDAGERGTKFHRAIVKSERIPNTKTGYYLDLGCGHRVMAFGNLDRAAGRALCERCEEDLQS